MPTAVALPRTSWGAPDAPHPGWASRLVLVDSTIQLADADSIFTEPLASEVLTNPLVTMSVIPDAGHSPHRDRPEATMADLLERIPA